MGPIMGIHYACIQLCLCAFSDQSAQLWALLCVYTMLGYSYACAHLVTSLRIYGLSLHTYFAVGVFGGTGRLVHIL